MAVVAFVLVGFCDAEVYPPGPLHAYVPPPVEESEMVAPVQYGPVLLEVATGEAFTVTVDVAVAVHPLVVPVTV